MQPVAISPYIALLPLGNMLSMGKWQWQRKAV